MFVIVSGDDDVVTAHVQSDAQVRKFADVSPDHDGSTFVDFVGHKCPSHVWVICRSHGELCANPGEVILLQVASSSDQVHLGEQLRRADVREVQGSAESEDQSFTGCFCPPPELGPFGKVTKCTGTTVPSPPMGIGNLDPRHRRFLSCQ
ncbi:Uncharacterised protein [Mycobacteroides abscessus subsp. abscessus]|nr:Uncharacterised protein [Mycobacteroides abscessus subsp. abscessus]